MNLGGGRGVESVTLNLCSYFLTLCFLQMRVEDESNEVSSTRLPLERKRFGTS
jgi:hypothetical protein